MTFARPKRREPVGEAGLFEYAVGALARRMRTERDLRRLMKLRAEEGEAGVRAMDAVVARLKELGYLSDERFAEDYTRVRKEHEKFGKRRVQQDLMQKGVGKELVATALESAYEDVDEVALARQYIARKRMKQPSGANAQKETVRAMNRLMRAGFSSRAIYKVLREWELPEEVEEGIEEGAEIIPYASSKPDPKREAARKKLLAIMDKGLDLGGTPFTDEERHGH